MATKAWITLTTRDLQEARHADLVEAVRRTALGLGQPDPLPGIIQGVIDELRGCIGFSGAYRVDSDPAKIAPNLADLAVQKIARVMQPRIGRDLSDDDRSAEATYQKRLEALNQGKWPVDTPVDATFAPSVQTTTGVEIARSTTRRATRDSLRGL